MGFQAFLFLNADVRIFQGFFCSLIPNPSNTEPKYVSGEDAGCHLKLVVRMHVDACGRQLDKERPGRCQPQDYWRLLHCQLRDCQVLQCPTAQNTWNKHLSFPQKANFKDLGASLIKHIFSFDNLISLDTLIKFQLDG